MSKNRAKRPPPMHRCSDDEHRAKGVGHVSWELEQLRETKRLYQIARRDPDTYPNHVRWALLESFLLHYRALAEFLSRSSPHPEHPDSVLAVNYVAGWVPTTFADIPRVHKRLAHISCEREELDANWKVDKMAERVEVEYARFLDLLDARWKRPAHPPPAVYDVSVTVLPGTDTTRVPATTFFVEKL